MTTSAGPPPIVYILVLAGLGGGGYYAYRQGWIPGLSANPSDVSQETSFVSVSPNVPPPVTAPVNPAPVAPPANLGGLPPDLQFTAPNPAVLQMDGSVTMVKFIQGLRTVYNQQFPNLPATYGIPDGKPGGTNRGIQNLLNGTVQIAASSRPLSPQELQAGLRAIPVARDALAVVVGVNNPYKGGLTMTQLAGIFQGRITNWSQVGGPNVPIKVLNRARDSGTHDLFRNLVLLGQDFAPDGPNFTTFAQDVTTPILRALGTDGISYTTVAQAANQQTIRIVPIEGILPTDTAAVRDGRYPISRQVFLAVRQQTSPAVKAFIDLALSPQGQAIAGRSDFLPL